MLSFFIFRSYRSLIYLSRVQSAPSMLHFRTELSELCILIHPITCRNVFCADKICICMYFLWLGDLAPLILLILEFNGIIVGVSILFNCLKGFFFVFFFFELGPFWVYITVRSKQMRCIVHLVKLMKILKPVESILFDYPIWVWFMSLLRSTTL